MDLMGKLKDATQGIKEAIDIWLNPYEQYQRAYEKGVLCKNYSDAVDDFNKAADGFQKDNNIEWASRARANSSLYTLLISKDWESLDKAVVALEPLQNTLKNIEEIGSKKEIQISLLVAELKALQLEHRALEMSSNEEKALAYYQAHLLLMELGDKVLLFSDKMINSGPRDKALLRAYYYGGLSDYYKALNEVFISPDKAHNYLESSAIQFRRSGDGVEELLSKVEGCIDQVKKRRHCWICGREMQGFNIFYKHYPAKASEYHKNLIKLSSEDIGMLDTNGFVTLCTLCGSVIEMQAQTYAERQMKEMRELTTSLMKEHERIFEDHSQRLKQLEGIFEDHSQRLKQLGGIFEDHSQRLKQLEGMSHQHNS